MEATVRNGWIDLGSGGRIIQAVRDMLAGVRHAVRARVQIHTVLLEVEVDDNGLEDPADRIPVCQG